MAHSLRSRPAGLELVGREVRVHRNLHNNSWSVRVNGFPTFHVREIRLRFGAFFVSRPGRARVQANKQRSVHAWCKGRVIDSANPDTLIPVSYDPYGDLPFFRRKDTQAIVADSYEVAFSTDADGKLHCLVHPDPF